MNQVPELDDIIRPNGVPTPIKGVNKENNEA
jgi:hypothetical protein